MDTAADGLLARSDSDPEAIRDYYDGWASDYDGDLESWGYDAPRVCAAYLRSLAAPGVTALDAGCGTGISGLALAAEGFANLVGVDFSAPSLERARARGVYRALHQVDLTRPPAPFADGHFGALVCVGVMSYLQDTEATCREFCRLVRAGAPIVFTQRGDLYAPRRTRAAIDALVDDGLWEEVEVTGEHDYLPGNPEFARVRVRYCVLRRL